ncbi:jg1055, partial [Pararge aegeria aegeria]
CKGEVEETRTDYRDHYLHRCGFAKCSGEAEAGEARAEPVTSSAEPWGDRLGERPAARSLHYTIQKPPATKHLAI